MTNLVVDVRFSLHVHNPERLPHYMYRTEYPLFVFPVYIQNVNVLWVCITVLLVLKYQYQVSNIILCAFLFYLYSCIYAYHKLTHQNDRYNLQIKKLH